MRIAFCLEYPIALRGGVSVLVETLAEELARAGHEIVLVSADTPESLRQSPLQPLLAAHIPWPFSKPSRVQCRQLAVQIKAAGVDLAHFHMGGNFGFGSRFPFCSAVYFLHQLGLPCVTSAHSVVDLLTGYCGPQKPLWFKLLLLPFAYLGKLHQLYHVRAEIAVSNHDYEKLRRWYAPLRGRIRLIYHSRLCADHPIVNPVPREKIILNVGHVAQRKGQQVLAEAFAQIANRHPEWRLEIVGKDSDGVTVEQIQRLRMQHGLENRLLLLGERNDVTSLMRRSAIYVQPSFEEALGLALQEAMACGCAVIGSRVGGIPELIENERVGMLVEAGNVSQLAATLEQLICDANRREQLGCAAAQSILDRGMTVGAMMKHHLELYDSVLRK